MSTTLTGLNVRKFEYPENEYVYDCALCDGDNDTRNGKMIGHPRADHPYTRKPKAYTVCPNCGGAVDPDLHWGVYVTRVSYMSYCSEKCAEQHDVIAALMDIAPRSDA